MNNLEYYMDIAIEKSSESDDPNTKVGACLVSMNGDILSTGCNKWIKGFPEENIPAYSREGKMWETKYPYVIHAEPSAIFAAQDLKSIQNSTLFVTLFPCHECAKLIAQFGIKEVIYMEDKYANTDSIITAKIIFEKMGIKTIQYSKTDILEEVV